MGSFTVGRRFCYRRAGGCVKGARTQLRIYYHKSNRKQLKRSKTKDFDVLKLMNASKEVMFDLVTESWRD